MSGCQTGMPGRAGGPRPAKVSAPTCTSTSTTASAALPLGALASCFRMVLSWCSLPALRPRQVPGLGGVAGCQRSAKRRLRAAGVQRL